MSTFEYTLEEAGTVAAPRVVPRSKGRIVVNWITSTDHKTIGYMYLISSFVFFCLGGVMALLIRAELFEPGMQILQTKEQYNQLFTMHGIAMLLMFATPLFAGFANFIMPLQIGAPDVAFPRLNALAFWFFLFGSTIAMSGFITPQGAASFGWFAYAPLSDTTFSPGIGGDLWVFGLALSGFGTILGAVNFITTIICMRAPGLTMWRMPIFTWNTLVTSILVIMAFPPLAAALFALGADRRFGARPVDPHRQLAPIDPDAQALAVGHLGGIADQRSVGALHHRVPAGQRGRRRQRRHPGAGVLQVPLGAVDMLDDRAPGTGAQLRDVVGPAVQQPVGAGQHRAGADRLQPALLLLDPGGDQVPGAAAQPLDQAALLADLRHDPVRGIGRGGRAHVGDVVDQGGVRLVPDGGHDRAGGPRPCRCCRASRCRGPRASWCWS